MSSGLRSIRPLSKDSLRGVTPASIAKDRPKFEWIDPASLFVEEGYQRQVGESGITLVRKIYAGFSWARFKPPVCVRLEGSTTLICIDGQHTAIAAASHPKIGKIPVMIVPAQDGDPAQDAKHRAAAFVGHNRDRVALTPPAIYRAELASGDPAAQAVDRACQAAGAVVLEKSINLRDRNHPVGSTIAIGTLKIICKRHGEEHLTRTLAVLIKAARGPIKAGEVDACSTILVGAGGVGDIDQRLAKVICSKSAEAWAAIAAQRAADTKEPIGSAIASAWCRVLGIRLSKGPGRQVLLRPPKAAQPASERQAAPTRVRPPPPAPSPAPAPPAPPAAPAPPAPAPAPSNAIPVSNGAIFTTRGVSIDLRTRELTHRGRTARIPKDEGVKLLAALATVMPALLDGKRLVDKAFGRGGNLEQLENLLIDLAPALARTRLEVKRVKHIGFSLFDLGE